MPLPRLVGTASGAVLRRAGFAVLALMIAACAAGSPSEPVPSELRAELLILRDRLSAVLDSTELVARQGEGVLRWMEEVDPTASSGGLVSGLRELVHPPVIPSGTGFVRDLVVTGALSRIDRSGVRRGLLDLDDQLARGGDVGARALDVYRAGLERHVSPGMWRHLFGGEEGTHSVDFRATAFMLDSVGFEAELRSGLRGLSERSEFLRARLTETDALLQLLDSQPDRRP